MKLQWYVLPSLLIQMIVFTLSATPAFADPAGIVTLAEIKTYLDTNMKSKDINDLIQKFSTKKPTLDEDIKGLSSPTPIMRILYATQIMNEDIQKTQLFANLLHDSSPVVRFATAYLFAVVTESGRVSQANSDVLIADLTSASQKEKQPLLKQFLEEHLATIRDESQKTIMPSNFPTSGLQIFATEADWCVWCKVLHKKLKSERNLKTIPLSVGEGLPLVNIPITFIDIEKDASVFKERQINKDNVPEFNLFQNNKLIYASYFKYGFDTRGIQKLIAYAANSEAYHVALETIIPQELSLKLKALPASDSKVIFIGTGIDKDENPLFVSSTIRFVRMALQKSFGLTDNRFITLFGDGTSAEKDTREMIGFLPHYIKVNDVRSDAPFTPTTLAAAYDAMRSQGVKNTLLVFSGHGSPKGLDTWGSLNKFTPNDLRKITDSDSMSTVIVSGNCYGGQFAEIPACGFFAARPDTEASGCWEKEEDKVKDYSSTFFQALKKSNKVAADTNKDGKISLEEAHWFAVLNGAESDVPFTTVDALAEKYFQQFPNALPGTVSMEQAATLKNFGNPSERNAFDLFAKGIKPGTNMTLKDRSVPFTVMYEGQKLSGTVMVTPYVSGWTYPVTMNSNSSRTAAAILRKEAIAMKIISANETLGEIYVFRSVVPPANIAVDANIPVNVDTLVSLGATFNKEDKSVVALAISAPVTIDFAVGVKPTFIQLMRRLAFKKLMSSEKANIDFKSRLLKASSCESQNLGDLLR